MIRVVLTTLCMFWYLKKHKFINLDFEMSEVEVPLNMRSKLRKELLFFYSITRFNCRCSVQSLTFSVAC